MAMNDWEFEVGDAIKITDVNNTTYTGKLLCVPSPQFPYWALKTAHGLVYFAQFAVCTKAGPNGDE